jgi:hypothetical protein
MESWEYVVILALAVYVGIQLPVWMKKLVPDTIGSTKIGGAIQIGIQVLLALAAAGFAWTHLNKSIDTAYLYLQEIAAKEQIARVVEVPNVWLALAAFVVIFWGLTTLFKTLPAPKNIWGTIGAIIVLGFVLFWPSITWKTFSWYVEKCLIGAEGMLLTEAYQAIKNGLP